MHATTRIVLTVETVALALAAAGGALQAVPWWARLQWTGAAWLGLPAGLGLMALTTVVMARVRPDMDEDLFRPLFRGVGVGTMAALSALSGFAEEALFRGVLQESWGILWSSALFGLLHAAPGRWWILAPWSALASVAMGTLYLWTGTLWAPMLCHAVNNFASMLYVRDQRGVARGSGSE